jgi:hypothetical protein
MDSRPVLVFKSDVMGGALSSNSNTSIALGVSDVVGGSTTLMHAAALQAEMIIPRSPSPIDLEETAVEDLIPEEMREIIRRQRASLTNLLFTRLMRPGASGKDRG